MAMQTNVTAEELMQQLKPQVWPRFTIVLLVHCQLQCTQPSAGVQAAIHVVLRVGRRLDCFTPVLNLG